MQRNFFPRFVSRSMVAMLAVVLGLSLFGCPAEFTASHTWRGTVWYHAGNDVETQYYDNNPQHASDMGKAFTIDKKTQRNYPLTWDAENNKWYLSEAAKNDYYRNLYRVEEGYTHYDKEPSRTMRNVWYDTGGDDDLVAYYDANPRQAVEDGVAYIHDVYSGELYPMGINDAGDNWNEVTLLVAERNRVVREWRTDHSEGTSDGNTDNPQDTSPSPSGSASPAASNDDGTGYNEDGGYDD
ncbi:MAG: hypothetical protein D6E12_04975 [Desulfovibrio sp.]|nr:MAG: hypothetical protein D6E12_04975 [Desulfovibrio sp.]